MSVAIRPHRLEDVDALFEAASESTAEVYPWLSWCRPGYTREEAQAWLPGSIERWNSGEQFEFAIVDRQGHYLGGCIINRFNVDDGYANLGYWVRTSATGRGVAVQAVRLLRDWTFARTDFQRLEIVVATENHRSARVAEKAGAHFEGILRARIRQNGRVHDARMYSLIRQ
jgi:ribosomal-protein-serine acetyltransferase